jgi:hypothetical protein
MKGQILAVFLIAFFALAASHNPNKQKKKFGCFQQCKDECKVVKQAKRQCVIPCKKACTAGDKKCKQACRQQPCAAVELNSEEDMANARSECKDCKVSCRPIFRKCWEDNCKDDCPTNKSKKQKQCRQCLKKGCGGIFDEEEEEDEESSLE